MERGLVNLPKLIKNNDFIEDFKSAILGNIIITIRDSKTHELLWSCHTGEFYGPLKKYDQRLMVDQDLDMSAILKELSKLED